jgi:hypothetical protein
MIFRIYGGDITHKHAKYASLGVIRYKVKNVYWVQDFLFEECFLGVKAAGVQG